MTRAHVLSLGSDSESQSQSQSSVNPVLPILPSRQVTDELFMYVLSYLFHREEKQENRRFYRESPADKNVNENEAIISIDFKEKCVCE